MNRLMHLVIFLACFQAMTQWQAYIFHYDQRLGEPLLRVAGYPLYGIFDYVMWYKWWFFQAPYKFSMPFSIMFGWALAVAFFRKEKSKYEEDDLGSSKWATREDMEKLLKRSKQKGQEGWNLYQSAGVVLGRFQGKILRHDGPEHVALFAPSRSGKGVGVIIPTLLDWKGSMFVLDIKRENFEKTAGYRNKVLKNRIIEFDPASRESSCWNPLGEVRGGDHFFTDIANIVTILIDPKGDKEKLEFWDEKAASLLECCIAYVMTQEDFESFRSIGGVVRFMTDPNVTFKEILETIKSDAQGEYREELQSRAQEFANMEDKTLDGILATALGVLRLYRDPIVQHVTSRNDFYVRDLMQANEPISLYLVVQPKDIERVRPLVRLMVDVLVKNNCEGGVSIRRNHRLLLLLDEFPSLGKIPYMETAIGFTAGYGMKMLIVSQSLNQITRLYSKENSILENCPVKVTFAASTLATAKEISEIIGKKTILKKSTGQSGNRFSMVQTNDSVNQQEMSRDLIDPSELTRLGPDECIVLIAGINPIRGEKVKYYKDTEYAGKFDLPVKALEQGNAVEQEFESAEAQ